MPGAADVSLASRLDQLEARFAEREPTLLAFLPEAGRFERLRREAAQLERRFPDPAKRPRLFGVPVGVKDIFHVDGFVTRAGSKLPPELLQGSEAESVTRLKNAGALIVGKTVTTEFAYFGPGPTRNPHNPAHTPGGSSSGSAAAVAAKLCTLALGTQTIGSIGRPASFCGVVGCKPSFGRISRAGVIPLSPSFDHVGFFTEDVAGARVAAGILCRTWRTEIAESKKPVLGIPEGPYLERASPEMLAHFRAVCSRLAAAGYEVKTVKAMSDFDAVYARHFLITNGEGARAHREWYPRFRDIYHVKTVEKLEEGRAVSDAALEQAWGERLRFAEALRQLMQENSIDLWLSPSAMGAAPEGLASTGDPVMNLPWSQAGFPVLSLPSGRSAAGLPLGLQLTAGPDADECLLAWAEGVERVLGRAHD
jgi:Asp-tRNA(Asn)/Glu-tRNA(Gln) amidotransferase A subunit family amidase